MLSLSLSLYLFAYWLTHVYLCIDLSSKFLCRHSSPALHCHWHGWVSKYHWTNQRSSERNLVHWGILHRSPPSPFSLFILTKLSNRYVCVDIDPVRQIVRAQMDAPRGDSSLPSSFDVRYDAVMFDLEFYSAWSWTFLCDIAGGCCGCQEQHTRCEGCIWVCPSPKSYKILYLSTCSLSLSLSFHSLYSHDTYIGGCRRSFLTTSYPWMLWALFSPHTFYPLSLSHPCSTHTWYLTKPPTLI